jgi:hypothetical protein
MSSVILVPQYDPDSRKIIIGHWQDVEDIIEKNKRLANQPKARHDAWRHYATIPNGILYSWWIEDTGGSPEWPILSDRYFNEFVAKRLEDPEWRALRVDSGPAHCIGWRPNGT